LICLSGWSRLRILTTTPKGVCTKGDHVHALTRQVDWTILRERGSEVPFVPQLDSEEDVSHFISKVEPWPRAAMNFNSQEEIGSPEDETEFLSFDYKNFTYLAQRNLELAHAEPGEPFSMD